MTDPTPAEIEAGGQAIRNWRYIPDAGDGCPSVRMGSGADLAEVVLRAVLPDRDARLREQVAEEIAAARPDSDWATSYPLTDWLAGYDAAVATARQIARAHTTGGTDE